jgi:hypothetical protein
MNEKQEFVIMLEAAFEKLSDGLEELQEAVSFADSENIDLGDDSVANLRMYLIAHLDNHIHGVNPYDTNLSELITRMEVAANDPQ